MEITIMLRCYPIIIVLVLAALTGCGESASKADMDKQQADTVSQQTAAETAPAATPSTVPDSNELLAHIDKYLTAMIPVTDSDPGILQLKNQLPGITVQKALVELTAYTYDNEKKYTDYYPFQNLEPGETKAIRLTRMSHGERITTRVVKLKAEALTGDSTLLLGKRP